MKAINMNFVYINFAGMKPKHLGVAALLLLMLGACAETEIPGTGGDSDRAVSFSAYTRVQTRGTEVKLANIKTSAFGIIAYLTNGNYSATSKSTFMENQQVEWKNSAWTYSPQKYWPNNGTDKLSFFAYAPYVATSGAQGIKPVNSSGADPKLDFTVQTNLNNMVDLLVAAKPSQSFSTVGAAGGKLTFDFHHVLASAKMYAKPSEDLAGNKQVRMYITGVKLKHSNKLAEHSVFNMNTSAWATPSSYLPAEIDLGNATNGIIGFSAISDVSGLTQGVQLTGNSAETPLFKTGHSLYLIPISGTTGCAEGDVKLEITYKLLTRATDSSSSWVTSTATRTVSLPAGGFKQGYSHSYVFTLGLDEITVDVVVDKLLIETAEDLVKFRNIVNGLNGEGKYAKLQATQIADIDMSTLPAGSTDITNWTPIEAFDGVYNGNGHTISNLKIATPTGNDTGLFASTTGNSVLTDVHLVNTQITGVKGNVGTLVGTASGIVSYCTSAGKITGAGGNVGGLIGVVESTANVTLCKSDVSIDMSGAGSNIGGFAGNNLGVIASCAAAQSVTQNNGNSYKYIGGFVGRNNKEIYGSYALGNATVYSGTNVNVGGFMGTANTLSVGCYAKGEVYLNASANNIFIGGFIGGYANGTFVNCFSIGTCNNVNVPNDWGGFSCRGSYAATNCFTASNRAQQSGGGGVTANAALNNIRTVVRTPYTSATTIKIAKNGYEDPVIIETTWDAEKFWSQTEGSDDAPEINWGLHKQ